MIRNQVEMNREERAGKTRTNKNIEREDDFSRSRFHGRRENKEENTRREEKRNEKEAVRGAQRRGDTGEKGCRCSPA